MKSSNGFGSSLNANSKIFSSLWCKRLADSKDEYAEKSNTLRLDILVLEALLKQGTMVNLVRIYITQCKFL
jgi:hypothetical protein